MLTISTNSDNDIFLDSTANLATSTEINALANISKNKVLTTLGEPEYNQLQGIPYFETIFADTPKIDLFQASIIDNLESLENVERVLDFQYTQNNGTFSYSLVENTTFGQIQLNG